VLSHYSTNFAAILLKADILYARGEERQAALFYSTALKAAPPQGQRSPALQSEVERAARMQQQMQTAYAGHLEAAMRERGFLDAPGTQRYEEAIDILVGRRQIFVQQPHYFYYPGLPQRQFYEREEFDWCAELESQTEAIRAEGEALLADEAAFRPYLHARPGMPQLRPPDLQDSADWSACYLIEQGRVVEDNADRCPATMAALERVPLCRVPDKTPNVLFSLLRPGTRIEPHHGLFNTRLICHLPLIVPEGCRLRVGNETRAWEPGKMLIFDDSIEHEAANDSDRLRMVLLFDIWRPEFSERDRAFVHTLFEAIDTYPDGSG